MGRQGDLNNLSRSVTATDLLFGLCCFSAASGALADEFKRLMKPAGLAGCDRRPTSRNLWNCMAIWKGEEMIYWGGASTAAPLNATWC